MLRRMSLTGDAMAHAILPGAAVGFFFAGLSVGAMTIGGLIAGCLVALLSGFVSRLTATGGRQQHGSVLFIIAGHRGHNCYRLAVVRLICCTCCLALHCRSITKALYLLGGISTVTIPALLILYRPLVTDCFDPQFLIRAKTLGRYRSLRFFDFGRAKSGCGIPCIGYINVSGNHDFTGRRSAFLGAANGIDARIFNSDCIDCLYASGLLLSFHVDWPTGPVIVLVLGLFYVVSVTFGPRGGLGLSHCETKTSGSVMLRVLFALLTLGFIAPLAAEPVRVVVFFLDS